jgi:hypothetical protein
LYAVANPVRAVFRVEADCVTVTSVFPVPVRVRVVPVAIVTVWELLETVFPELAISYWARDPAGPWVCRSKGVLLESCGLSPLPVLSISCMR